MNAFVEGLFPSSCFSSGADSGPLLHPRILRQIGDDGIRNLALYLPTPTTEQQLAPHRNPSKQSLCVSKSNVRRIANGRMGFRDPQALMAGQLLWNNQRRRARLYGSFPLSDL
jgi:hypothetical protein